MGGGGNVRIHFYHTAIMSSYLEELYSGKTQLLALDARSMKLSQKLIYYVEILMAGGISLDVS